MTIESGAIITLATSCRLQWLLVSAVLWLLAAGGQWLWPCGWVGMTLAYTLPQKHPGKLRFHMFWNASRISENWVKILFTRGQLVLWLPWRRQVEISLSSMRKLCPAVWYVCAPPWTWWLRSMQTGSSPCTGIKIATHDVISYCFVLVLRTL